MQALNLPPLPQEVFVSAPSVYCTGLDKQVLSHEASVESEPHVCTGPHEEAAHTGGDATRDP